MSQSIPHAAVLVSRAVCYRRYGYGTSAYNCNSKWYTWGRWVLAGILILVGLFLLALCLFCSRRRRNRRNRNKVTPMTYQAPAGGYNQQYGNQGYGNQYAPPPGAPPQYGNEYYGQQGGVTQPGNTYQPGK